MRTFVCASLGALMAFGLAGCDKTPTEPSPPAATVVLTGFNITSMPTGTGIGQTVQITATAEFSDKTTKNVTSEAVWTSLDPSVATVSAAGLVTVLQFGTCNITAQFQSRSATRQFSARLPSGGLVPFRLSGVATDDEGRPLAGAEIFISYAGSDVTRSESARTTTDGQGRYEADFEAKLGGYFRGSTAQVTIIGDGHERDDRWFRPTNNDTDQTLDLHPRVIRWISVGKLILVTVADDGAPCVSNIRDMPNYSIHWVCRTVRLVMPADGVLTVEAASGDQQVHPNLTMEGPGILDCCYMGNPLSMTLAAGMVVKINVEILEGEPPQTFALRATIR